MSGRATKIRGGTSAEILPHCRYRMDKSISRKQHEASDDARVESVRDVLGLSTTNEAIDATWLVARSVKESEMVASWLSLILT